MNIKGFFNSFNKEAASFGGSIWESAKVHGRNISISFKNHASKKTGDVARSHFAGAAGLIASVLCCVTLAQKANDEKNTVKKMLYGAGSVTALACAVILMVYAPGK